jgi:hypothetical protein
VKVNSKFHIEKAATVGKGSILLRFREKLQIEGIGRR